MKALPAASAGSHGAEGLPAPPESLFCLPWQTVHDWHSGSAKEAPQRAPASGPPGPSAGRTGRRAALRGGIVQKQFVFDKRHPLRFAAGCGTMM